MSSEIGHARMRAANASEMKSSRAHASRHYVRGLLGGTERPANCLVSVVRGVSVGAGGLRRGEVRLKFFSEYARGEASQFGGTKQRFVDQCGGLGRRGPR